MNCEFYLNLIEDFLEDEIDEQTAARINSHVFACKECAAQLEVLKHIKEIYAHYLFAAEPPPDLWTKFQAKLANEENSRRVVVPATTPFWKTYSFGLRHLSAPSAFAACLIVLGIGFGLLHFLSNRKPADNQFLAGTETNTDKSPAANILETNAEIVANNSTETKSGSRKNAPPVFEKINHKNSINDYKNSRNAKNTVAANLKLTAERRVIAGQIAVLPSSEKKSLTDNSRLNEQFLARQSEFKNLEIETARQLEKVELLLRTFRNARAGEVNGNALYDVAYEKHQARKLLEKNSRLRQSSEMFGMADALELLNRVEPYLLEIANLEKNSAPSVVTDIRERVKNQNIIAGVQGFNNSF